MTAFGKGAVTSQASIKVGLGYVIQLLARHMRPIKRSALNFHILITMSNLPGNNKSGSAY